MGRITLSIKTEKRTNEILSVEDFKDRFLYGITIQSGGKELPESTYRYWLQFATEQVEKYLTVKFNLQIYEETKNFHFSDWKNWSMIKATYPVVAGLMVQGYIASVMQVDYPKDWISVKRNVSEDLYSRLLHIIPNTNSPFQQIAAIYTGMLPNAGWIAGGTNTPNYWNVKYITGFKRLPADIETAVGMLAAINILTVGNETMAAALGALGASSKSISIDGLSQSTSLYVNGQTGIFGARIKQYTETLMGVGGKGGLLDRLRDYYGAIVWLG